MEKEYTRTPQRIFLLLFMLLLAIGHSQSAFDAIRRLTPQEFKELQEIVFERLNRLDISVRDFPTLEADRLFTDETCANHGMGGELLAAQGARIAGGTGAVTFANQPGVNSQHIGSVYDLAISASLPNADEKVAILIVDIFDQEGHRGDVIGTDPFSGLSHGDQVFLHTIKVLEALTNSSPSASTDFDAGISERTISGVLVRAVPINPDDAASIGGIIGGALHDLHQEGFTRAAVNMSWGLVPCGLRDDFRYYIWSQNDEHQDEPQERTEAQERYPSYEHYLEELIQKNLAFYDELCSGFAELTERLAQLGSPNPTIPCGILVVVAVAENEAEVMREGFPPRLAEPIDTFFVASAGNYGLSFPLAPASWEGITSVAATYFSDNNKANFSNDHKRVNAFGVLDCLVTGAWFNLTETNPPSNHTLIYAGTSFAAPIVSAVLALGGTYGNLACYP